MRPPDRAVRLHGEGVGVQASAPTPVRNSAPVQQRSQNRRIQFTLLGNRAHRRGSEEWRSRLLLPVRGGRCRLAVEALGKPFQFRQFAVIAVEALGASARSARDFASMAARHTGALLVFASVLKIAGSAA